MFTVDVELKCGGSRAVEFPTKAEAVAYAGRMAQDSAVTFSAVRGLAMAKDTIHPDYKRVKHLASVEAAAQKLREAIRANKGTYENGGRAQKAAEEELNRVVEKALEPK